MAALELTLRVLVTGHLGYIGSILVPMLVARGAKVMGCDVGLFEDCAFVGAPTPVENIGKDIRDLGRDDIAGHDAVIHLAGLSNDPLGDFMPRVTHAVNGEAAVRLARLAREAGVRRFLFASTCSVYGAAGEELLAEDAPLNPVTPYAAAKHRAEVGIAAFAGDGFSPVVLRAGTVYGVSPRIRFDLVLNNLVAWAAATGEVYLKSDGGAWRPLVHVADVARAYVVLLDAPASSVHNKAFNIGRTGQNYRVRELAGLVVDNVPGSRVVYAPDASQDRRNYRVDCDFFETLMDDAVQGISPAEGIRELHAALVDYPVGPEDFEGRRFSRIAHLRHLVDAGRLDSELYAAAGAERVRAG